MSKRVIGRCVGGIALSMLVGCGMSDDDGGSLERGMGQMPPPTVIALQIEERSLQPVDEYIAMVEPVQDVMLRSEVSGYVDAVHFVEGGLVQEGDVLFSIDRRTYQAEADAAEADLMSAKKLYERMKSADARSVSPSDLETAESNWLRAKAAFARAQVSLDYTEIKAPVSGRIGAALVTKGNYVSSASKPLARIVQLDPVRVVFSLTDRDYLSLRQRELSETAASRIAQVRLPEGTVLSMVGQKEFDDNAINPQTGTIAVRYLFENREGLLIPGGYVTALVQDAGSKMGICIPQKAVLIDQQGTYVLTVDEAGVVAIARVVSGEQLGADVVVSSGLHVGDRVVVDGLQKARPGATVQVVMLEDK